MVGLILCGGQSSRMGRDKGLLESGAVSWARLAADRLSRLGLLVVLSVNPEQLHTYRSHLPGSILVADHPQLPVGGPLKGILSAHLQHPDEDLLVTACDLPFMKDEVLRDLIKERQGKAEEAFVYRDHEGVEPLCGIYAAAGVSRLLAAVQESRLQNWSLHYVLDQMNTYYLPLPADWKAAFRNCNHPSDILC